MSRPVVIARDGVALVETVDADRDAMAGHDGLFDVDPDPRPLPMPVLASRLTIVDGTDRVLGHVSWVSVFHGPTIASVAINIGILLLPTARGRGIGTLAQRLLIEYLFDTTEVHRLEASTDVDNLAEQHALTKAGMHRDGTLRGAQRREGQWRDLALFSILRPEL